MKKYLFALSLFVSSVTIGQNYQPDWESLDSRPVPQWFRDGKFGIFIHWGVYAVPGWCTKGNYAEWYQYGLQTTDSARMKFHKAKFGDRSYYDLANDFKAELFNPDEWARVFERAGAKYIVLTSKHHDGFTLWPNREANKTWGFPWNSVDIGPKRDLLGDLFKAVRKTSVHAGMYYSLYEWFNPLWKADKTKYANEHVWPQMKELINTYKPDVFWTDGDWEASDEVWKSKEFLAWLYNESPVKDKVVTYDRWGSNVRFHHGAVFTPEYQPDLDFEDHYWEESRGMGFSYGYNREEDAWDYNSTESLVQMLIDKVSRGGNFLLDIGPDEHGKIPPIMQERLLQIGEWLKINGEAIYHTQRWKQTSQWSDDLSNRKTTGGGDQFLKMPADPEPGLKVKEIFFTYNASSNTLYAIFPRYPSDKKLVLRDLVIPGGSKIIFLSTGETVSWKAENNNTIINLPGYDPNLIKAPYAFAVKIENYGKYELKPQVNVLYKPGELKPVITMNSGGDADTYYTTDGSEPTRNSYHYNKPFVPDKSIIIKVISYPVTEFPTMKILPSAIVVKEIKVYQWMDAMSVSKPDPGIAYRYFEPDGRIDMNSVKEKEKRSGITDKVDIARRLRTDKFAFEFTGYIKITKPGIYNFFTESDDGSKLFIDDTEVVNNDGDHGTLEKEGKAALKKGMHKIRVIYFDSGGGNALKLSFQPEGGKKEEVPAMMLFH